MPTELADVLMVVGRVLLGGFFVNGGVHHFFIMPPLVEAMTTRGVPMPKPVLIAGSVFQTVLGVLLILGLYVTWAALGLVLFTVAATIMFLNFWDKTEPERDQVKTGAITNVGIVGGLLIAAATGL